MILEFVKIGKEYISKHGSKWFHIYFKDDTRSYRTALYKTMRNYINWEEIIESAERGDEIHNLRTKIYKGKPIIDADSKPVLYSRSDIQYIIDTANHHEQL